MDRVISKPVSEQMLTDETVQGHQERPADHQHELHEVSVNWIAIGAALLVMGVTVVFLLLWGLLNLYVRHPERPVVPPSPLALIPRQPPPPRLQENPPANYAAFLKDERAELHSSGWVDRAHNVSRISIEAAEEELLRQGVPTQAQAEGTILSNPMPGEAAQPAADTNAAEASGRLPLHLQPTGAQRLGIGPTGRAQ